MEHASPSPAATSASGPRIITVIIHVGRTSAIAAARQVIRGLLEAGLRIRLLAEEISALPDDLAAKCQVAPAENPLANSELALVIGGDGTLLRAAEAAFGAQVPLLGINLGHVGFLADAEDGDLTDVVQRIAAGQYDVEERMTLDVTVVRENQPPQQLWAVNEASIEKVNRERMIHLVYEVDGRPVSRFAGDGMVLATPTGSTAYAFSAGGPVLWPQIEAVVLVPICAHALFSRPLVVAPDTVPAVEILDPAPGVLWCDGRRSTELPVGSRVEVRRSARTILLARIALPNFADRLVAKFALPVRGWRG